jgi:Zn ribbon nucleic-acid-binding protein
MAIVSFEITNCKQCKFLKTDPAYSEDSFERDEKWTCGRADKVIDESVSWSEESRIKIPFWCPILVKE